MRRERCQGDTDQSSSLSLSLSNAHREAGFVVFVGLQIDELWNQAYWPVITYSVNVVNQTDFPGFLVGNHFGPNTRGPMKDDWSEYYSTDLTVGGRNER
jgi:hypothetical protein